MGSTYFNKRIPMRTPVRRPRARPKSFETQELAEAYAKAQGMKNYTIRQISTHKFCIEDTN